MAASRSSKPVEVAAHQRLHIGVGAGRAGALEFADFGRDLRGERERQRRDRPRGRSRRRAAHAADCDRRARTRSRSPRRRDPRPAGGPSPRPPTRRAATAPGHRHRAARAPRAGDGAAPGSAALRERDRRGRSGSRVRPRSTSRKPCVVIRPTLAPVRSITVLVTSVVPCTTLCKSAGLRPTSPSSRCVPADDRLARVVGRRQELAGMDEMAARDRAARDR